MSFPFTELPRGLTGALGVKDMGALPRVLAADVALTVEAMELFLFNRRETVQASEGATVVGFTASANVVVPAGEAWYLWAANAGVTTAAGEACTFATALRIGGAGVIVSDYVTLPASSGGAAAVQAYPARWLAPGEGLAISATAVTGVPVKTFTAVITRCRI